MIVGAVEAMEANRICGWAACAEDEEDRLLVEAFVRGRLRGAAMADGSRPGWPPSEPARREHGFVIDFSRPLAEADLNEIEIYATAATGERALIRPGPGGANAACADRAGIAIAAPGPALMPRGLTVPGGLGPAGAAAPSRSPAFEIAVAFERLGLRRFSGGGWAGSRGERLVIAAFGVRGLGAGVPPGIKVKGFGGGGRETAWLGEGELCGLGRPGLPLTGFAIRCQEQRYEALYEGRFRDGAAAGPCRDGEPCRSALAGDPLTAIRLAIRER